MDEYISAENLKHRRSVAPDHSASYDLFILVLTLVSLVVAAELIIRPFTPAVDAIFLRVDLLLCAVFLFDFLLNLLRAPDTADYFLKRGGWLDLQGAVPAGIELRWTAFLRLARLNRLVRIV